MELVYLILLAPLWGLAITAIAVHDHGETAGSFTYAVLTDARTFYAFYTPFVWCLLVVLMGANPFMIYAITVFAAYVMSAHMMDRYRVPIWKRVVYSMMSFVLIGFVLYKSNLFKTKPARITH